MAAMTTATRSSDVDQAATESVGPIQSLHALREAVSIPLDDVGGLPFYLGSSIGLSQSQSLAMIPGTGMPVLVLLGPFSIRAALILTTEELVVRPLPPLAPSTRLRRLDIASVEIEHGHWYAPGKNVVAVRRHKGPTLRLMTPFQGIQGGGDTLGLLIKAWLRADLGRF